MSGQVGSPDSVYGSVSRALRMYKRSIAAKNALFLTPQKVTYTISKSPEAYRPSLGSAVLGLWRVCCRCIPQSIREFRMVRYITTLERLGKDVTWLILQQARGIPEAKVIDDFMVDRTIVQMFAKADLSERRGQVGRRHRTFPYAASWRCQLLYGRYVRPWRAGQKLGAGK